MTGPHSGMYPTGGSGSNSSLPRQSGQTGFGSSAQASSGLSSSSLYQTGSPLSGGADDLGATRQNADPGPSSFPSPFGAPTLPDAGSSNTLLPSPQLGVATATSAPVLWLFLATACAGVALAGALLFGETVWISFVSWALAGIGTLAFVTVFVRIDTERRTSILYGNGNRALATALYTIALLLGGAALVVSALHIAFWAGRGF